MARKIIDLNEDILFEGDEWLLVTDNDDVSKKLSTGRVRDYTDTAISTLSGTLVDYTDNYISTCSGSLQEQLDTKATTSYVTTSLSSKVTTVSGSTINYTVGSGSQFETIKECFDYIGSTFHAGESAITITLATQVHRINTGPIINRDFNHKITVLCNNQEIRVTANTGSTVFDLLGSGYLIFKDAVFISESAVSNSYLKLMYCYYSTVYFYNCIFTNFNWVVDGLYSTILIEGCSITTYSSGTGWTVLFVRNSSLYITDTVADNVVPAGYSHFVWGTESSVIDVGWTTVSVRNFNVGFYAEYGTQITIGAASFTNTAVQYKPTKGIEGNTLALIVDADNSVRRITSDGLNLFNTGYTPTVPLSPVNKGYVDSEIVTLSGVLNSYIATKTTSSYVDSEITTISGYLDEQLSSLSGTITTGPVFTYWSSGEIGSMYGGATSSGGGSYSFIGGGDTNTIAVGADYSAIVGGANNSLSGSYSFIGTGDQNTGSGDYVNILGGNGNTVTNVEDAEIIGSWNTVGGDGTGRYGLVVVGYDNQMGTGDFSYVFGTSNILEGHRSYIIGDSNTTNNRYTIAIGFHADASNSGQIAFGSSEYATTGTIQGSKYILGRSTGSTSPVVLTTNNAAVNNPPGCNNQIILKNTQSVSFHGTVVARKNDSTANAAWKIEGLIIRNADAASTTLVDHTVTAISNTPGWSVALSADTTYGGLTVTFTGTAGVRAVATIDTAEVIY